MAPKSRAPLQGRRSALEPPGLSLVVLGLRPSAQQAGPRQGPDLTLPLAPCVLVSLLAHPPVPGSDACWAARRDGFGGKARPFLVL